MRKVCCRHCTPLMFQLTKLERDRVIIIELQMKIDGKETRRKLFLTTNPRLASMTFLPNLYNSLIVIANNKVHINLRPIIPLKTMMTLKKTSKKTTPRILNFKILQAQLELTTKKTNPLMKTLILLKVTLESLI